MQWRALAEQAGDEEAYDDDGMVHLFRLRIKRMRAMLQLLRPQLPRELRVELDHGLRDIGRKLSDIRMAAVLGNCEKYLSGATSKASPETFARDSSEIRATLALDLQRYSAALDEHMLPDFSVSELCNGVIGIYRRARRRFNRWQLTSEHTDAHDCRKHTKYLMYAIDYSHPWLKENRRMRKQLGLLEDALGNMNDLVEFEARNAHIDMSSEVSAYANTALGLCESIYSVKPKKLMRHFLKPGETTR